MFVIINPNCHDNSEFRFQKTGIFSNELYLGRKNAHFLVFLYIAYNQRLMILHH